MADTTVTTTGLTELKRAIEVFPEKHTAALRAVAKATADRVLANARANLAAQTKGTGALAGFLEVREQAEKKQFVVGANPGLVRVHPWNLMLWLEYGTVRAAARPFMRPAADKERDRYQQDLARASEDIAKGVFGE